MGFCKNKIFSNVFHETDFEREKKVLCVSSTILAVKNRGAYYSFSGQIEVFYSCFCDKNVEKWCIVCTLQMVK